MPTMPDHLNSKGAEKISKILNQDVILPEIARLTQAGQIGRK
jgi:hypothetical protein